VSDTRQKDANWKLNVNANGTVSTEQAQLAVLMDIRDRLDVLRCSDFLSIPWKLQRIDENTRKPRRARPMADVLRHRLALRRARELRRGAR
jgi:hypothetical protein